MLGKINNSCSWAQTQTIGGQQVTAEFDIEGSTYFDPCSGGPATADACTRALLIINAPTYSIVYQFPQFGFTNLFPAGCPNTAPDGIFCCLPNIGRLDCAGPGCTNAGSDGCMTITPASFCAACNDLGTVYCGCGSCGGEGPPLAKTWTTAFSGVGNGTGQHFCDCCTTPVGPECDPNAVGMNLSVTVEWTRVPVCQFQEPAGSAFFDLAGCPAQIGGGLWKLYYDQVNHVWRFTNPMIGVEYTCAGGSFVCNGVNTFTLAGTPLFCSWPSTITLTPA